MSKSLMKRIGGVMKSWYFPAAIATTLIAGLIYWLIPNRSTRIVTVDGRYEWKGHDVPAKRQFVWNPAEALAAVKELGENLPEFRDASLIRPQLSDAGGTLYFTLRKADGSADIYRARMIDGKWQPPQPVTAFNSQASDIGPAIATDGGEAYFYSNRPGGYGGFDLYVSKRTGSGWSKPHNLGPLVNTPAHEYDPALTPDGLRLLFASNRTKAMQKNIAKMAAEEKKKEWAGTLRAQPGLSQFDLYTARRDATKHPWASPLPVKGVNRNDSNEGAPAVSPNGIHLFFASDRKGGQGGFDLYRARWKDGIVSRIENLGPGVNGQFNEMEPAVSPEGFTLVFSTDRDRPGEQYVLYESRATEVIDETDWDDANWRAFVSVLQRFWPWMLLATLLLAALFLLWRRYSQQFSEKTLAARFFLTSVLMHLLILLLAGFITIGKVILEERNELQGNITSTDVSQNALHESHEKGPEAFEKLADLKAVENAAVQMPQRQIRQPQNIANQNRKLTPTISAEQVAHLPRDRVIFNPNPAKLLTPKLRKLQRQPRKLDNRIAAMIPENLELKKDFPAKENPIKNQPNNLPRQVAIVKPKPVPRGLNVPRRIPGNPLKPIAELKESDAKPINRPKTQLLAKQTIRYVPAVKPQTGGKVPNKLSVTEENKTAPVGPGDAIAKRGKSAAANPSSPVKKAAALNEPPVQPGAATIVPAKKAINSAQAAQRRAGWKLVRNRIRPLKPALGEDEKSRSLLAKNDEQKSNPPIQGNKTRGRKSTPSLKSIVSTPKRTAGASNPLERRTLIGRFAKRNNFKPPAFNRHASRLQRRFAKAPRVAYVREAVGAQRMFILRKPDVRKKFLPLLGATKESESAVDRGLHWIARHQMPDGSWSLNQFNRACQGHKKCSGHGNVKSDTAATGFALLPFLGRGQTHQKGEYKTVIDRGLKWLIKKQKKNGDLFTGGTHNGHMYSHGIATIALCEGFGMSRDPNLKGPAQKAIDFIVASQHKSSGGWRYRPRERGDTSVVGWQVMALKSGEMAGLKVSAKTLKLAGKWLDSVESRGKMRGYGYTNRGASHAMSAEGLLCRQFLGMPRDDKRLIAGADFLLKFKPRRGRLSSYYWYYGTQVMYHLQGKHWKQWNESTRKLLRTSQVTKSGMAGTWNPSDRWEQQAGRLYATSLKLLMLEVYYRHLPLYQQLGAAAAAK